jgi:hypothetical protein
MQVRVWTEEDVTRLRNYKTEHYWGRGRKKPRKKKTKRK